jgi:hypothetical protein
MPVSRSSERPLPPLPSLATDVPLPEMTELELEEARRPLTPMEMDEAEHGWFGSRPLEVRDGVAVMEEGVEGHFADLRVEGVVSQV